MPEHTEHTQNKIDCTALQQQMQQLGASGTGVVQVAEIRFERAYRKLCASNACGNYGKCWMCPPDVGDIDALIAAAQQYDKAIVYQSIGVLEDSYDFEGMMEAGAAHNQLALAIAQKFAALPCAKSLHLGAGGCHICPVCAKKTDEACRHPNLAMAGLETYGIAVSELAALAGLKYMNGQDTVTYFGAFFYKE